MLAEAVAGQQSERNVLVGQSLGDLLEPGAARATLTLATPDGRREELRSTTDQDGTRWSFGDTQTSGIYTVEIGSPVNRQEIYAVNVDTAESNLARVDPQELPHGFTMNRQNDLDEPDGGAVSRRGGLHKALLYGVLGLLFCETFLAWRFGNRRS
jgi:hypothetical protein